MLSIKECRKILGKKYSECTDEQILSIRDWLTELAKINIETMRRKNKIENTTLI